MSFIVSLIGRPNTGKSSLYNALVGGSRSRITFDMPGVTRDRHYGDLIEEDDLKKKEISLVDTGGFFPQFGKDWDLMEQKRTSKKSADPFYVVMAEQARFAIAESDHVLLVVDGREGPQNFDLMIAEELRKSERPFWVVVNKIDSVKQEGLEFDFFQIGVTEDQLFSVSAAHKRGTETLRSALFNLVSWENRFDDDEDEFSAKTLGAVALVGTPNSGKSTLLNCLIQRERAIISPIAGTTVDPIEDVWNLNLEGHELAEEYGPKGKLKIVDTAGIRRKARIEHHVEQISVYRALRCLSECDIALLVVDAELSLKTQDLKIASLALEKGKSLILVINKVDLKDWDDKNRRDWIADLKAYHPWLNFSQMVLISALKKKGLGALKAAVLNTLQVRNKKLPTSKVNKALMSLCERHTLMLDKNRGKSLKIKYATMVKSDPPTFLVNVNKEKGIPDSYRRYLANGMRKVFDMRNTPVHFIFRKDL